MVIVIIFSIHCFEASALTTTNHNNARHHILGWFPISKPKNHEILGHELGSTMNSVHRSGQTHWCKWSEILNHQWNRLCSSRSNMMRMRKEAQNTKKKNIARSTHHFKFKGPKSSARLIEVLTLKWKSLHGWIEFSKCPKKFKKNLDRMMERFHWASLNNSLTYYVCDQFRLNLCPCSP